MSRSYSAYLRRSFKSKQSLEYIEAVLRDFNRDFQARADLAVAAVIVGGTGSSIGSYQDVTTDVIRGIDSSIASTQSCHSCQDWRYRWQQGIS